MLAFDMKNIALLKKNYARNIATIYVIICDNPQKVWCLMYKWKI